MASATDAAARSPALSAVVYAGNLDRVVDFYAAVIGLTPVERTDGFAVLVAPGIEFTVVAIPDGAADAIESPTVRREETPIKVVFTVERIARCRELAAMHDGVIDPADREWEFRGLRRCDGHDPEGNVLQVAELVS
ncbi:MAG: hypothetical protein Q7V62_05605 [Actinomycetota bacterium]|nr:hypothetical protein [Actinomycetota bacterium]